MWPRQGGWGGARFEMSSAGSAKTQAGWGRLHGGRPPRTAPPGRLASPPGGAVPSGPRAPAAPLAAICLRAGAGLLPGPSQGLSRAGARCRVQRDERKEGQVPPRLCICKGGGGRLCFCSSVWIAVYCTNAFVTRTPVPVENLPPRPHPTVSACPSASHLPGASAVSCSGASRTRTRAVRPTVRLPPAAPSLLARLLVPGGCRVPCAPGRHPLQSAWPLLCEPLPRVQRGLRGCER